MRMNPLLPLALLIPGGGFLAFALRKKAQAQAPTTPAPADVVSADQSAAQAAQDALAAQADHESAVDATAAAMNRSDAASRQAAESTAAAQKASADVATAQAAVQSVQQAGAPPSAVATAQAALDAAKAVHDRELAAAAQAATEAQVQKSVAAQAAKQALDAKQKKVAAVHRVAAAQKKAAAVSPSTSSQALYLAATALNDFLYTYPYAESFGSKKHPSGPVSDFQKIATKYGQPLVNDGVLGPKTRSVAELVGVVLPPRPPAAAHPTQPGHAAPPAPAPAPSSRVDLARAKTLAGQVVANMRKLPAQKRYDYDRNLLKAFQTAAGLPAQGVYGGETRGALIYFGQANAPKPLFAPVQTVPYHPPAV
jgi:hypothetical protein